MKYRLSFILSLVCSAASGSAAVVVFQQGVEITRDGSPTGEVYAGGHDAELNAGSPETNFDYGTGGDSVSQTSTNYEIGIDGAGLADETQMVLRFDHVFDALPNGATIDSAELFLESDNKGDDLLLYQIADGISWDETTVTWNSFGSGNDGVAVGAETTGSSLTIDGQGNKIYLDVTSIVQSWYSGSSSNSGFAIVPTGTNGVDLDSMENLDDLSDRPALSITYSAVPEPGTYAAVAGLLALGLAFWRRRSRRPDASYLR